jgi:hypothetical protein
MNEPDASNCRDAAKAFALVNRAIDAGGTLLLLCILTLNLWTGFAD